MLLDEGKLRLDDPLKRWMPEFADMRVLKAADGPLDDTVPSPRDITVEDLFTHRSGLAYSFTATGPIAQEYQRALGDPLTGGASPDAWLKKLAGLPLLYAPGTRFHYSHATDVLGFLVGRIAGMPLRDVLMERILGPLGMADTDFYIPPQKRDRAATLYRQDEEAHQLVALPMTWPDSPPAFCGGGGGLVSTADDYLAFARMMLARGEAGGRRYLKPETWDLMMTNRLTAEQRTIPFLGNPIWRAQGFGLGVSVITNPDDMEGIGIGGRGAFGWPGAFGTWWQADPANDMVLIYLIQNARPLTPGSAALATGQVTGARAVLPMFQTLAYGARTD
jgi:CubicO group peptidase (beta-lactamase class C family)